MFSIKGRFMRYGILGIIMLALNGVASVHSAPDYLNHSSDERHKNEFTLPNSFFESVYLETASVDSQHLDQYDRQDVEKQHADKNQKHVRSVRLEASSDEKVAHVLAAPAHQFSSDIFVVSQEYNIDPLLLHAIAEVESRYNTKAVSRAGAQGLMQVLPDTARRFGMKNPEQELFDPVSNLRVSSNYLRSLHKLFGNNIRLILAAYNAGENAVIRYGYTIPPFKETKNYVDKVMKRYLELKQKSYQL
jgi:soluble lytic murein transglycosylase-like protein